MRDDAARRVAERYDSRFLRGYIKGKLRSDPVYNGTLERVGDRPLFDLGCGVGVLEFYLRELGFTQPILGIDHDAKKVAVATRIASSYRDVEFVVGDARSPIPPGMSVTALDILHYFRDQEQSAILENIAAAVPPGGVAIIRDAVRDGSLRYRITKLQEMFSRAIRWLKAERLNFPTRERIVAPFRARGFAEEIVPLWGRTPFNNYLFVFRRESSGTTKR
jgi:SAM-dependent methyltransferase